jgi:ATP-dependent DNA helicase RecG
LDITELNIGQLPGLTEQKVKVLNKEVNIFSLSDLLYYFPYGYIDRSRIWKISEIDGETEEVQLKGQILYFDTVGEGERRRLVGKFTDGTDTIDLVWFKPKSNFTSLYKTGVDYIIFGDITEFNHIYNMVHPEIDPAWKEQQVASGKTPKYITTKAMKRVYLNSRAIQNLQFKLLKYIQSSIPETLPPQIIVRYGFPPLLEALRNIHFPSSDEQLRKSEYRLKFEELFYLQLNIMQTGKMRREKLTGYTFERIKDSKIRIFVKNYLPFRLTSAQVRVMQEIRKDIESGRQMNRLLQGDVGSGKTLVALMSMLIAVDNGYQACMMAPTEILANQHYATICEFLRQSECSSEMQVRVELLTGSTTKKQRRTLLPALERGEIDILVGTHALIEASVQFKPGSPGLAVIDEQHRFGVEQRSKLWIKSKVPPHVLIMSATPIPRTLAMTLYGDLDVSVIDEMPPGRKPIITKHCYDTQRDGLMTSLKNEIAKGRQAYVVYPLIEESENLDYKNLEDGYEEYCRRFPQYKICKVHGRMNAVEKEAAMQRFVSGEAQILIATTVIEVGVNVPNASLMVIESAERFGLSQLHQLRGRVGRGAEQSYCILISTVKLTSIAKQRLKIMVTSSDGFYIAEEDMKLRGSGDLEGLRQSGDGLNLKLSNLADDGDILMEARNMASQIINDDPELTKPENALLRKRIDVLFHGKVNWGLIS